MPDTIRQQIITAFDTAMKVILVTGGYSSDLGLNVFPWRDTALDIENDEFPAIVYRDVSEEAIPPEQVGFGKHQFKLNLDVLIFCEEGATTPEEMRLMIADIYKAVGLNQQWNGLAFWTEPVLDQILIQEEKNIIGGARIQFQILYRTARFDPFSQ
jgi:hypothetical protein